MGSKKGSNTHTGTKPASSSMSKSKITLLVLLVAILFAVFKKDKGYGPFPECNKDSLTLFHQQLQGYYHASSDVAGYKELHGECAFSKTYKDARQKFLVAAGKVKSAKTSKYKVADDLYIDVVDIPGDPDNILISTSGVHGPEGFAGSGIQTSVLSMLSNTKEMSALYAKAASTLLKAENTDEDGEPTTPPTDLPPTLIFIHAVNPYGFANNRRFNEDNIDLNRNFLTDEKFAEVRARDPNFAGYVDIDFLINPTWMPFGTITGLNDIWGHLKSVYAVTRYGITTIKRALVAGNYFRQDGLGFGGFTRSKSAQLLIQISAERRLENAKRVVLIDHHTGLGPSGTDTLALLGKNDVNFTKLINDTFPKELDGDLIVGGDKASDAEGSAMSGYELTIGTMDHFCETWMHPKGDHTKDILCLTQEFGTVPVVEVGKAQMEENFAYHYGNDEQKKVYGERLKGVFYVETEKWMRNVAHRGVTLWMQAYGYVEQS